MLLRKPPPETIPFLLAPGEVKRHLFPASVRKVGGAEDPYIFEVEQDPDGARAVFIRGLEPGDSNAEVEIERGRRYRLHVIVKGSVPKEPERGSVEEGGEEEAQRLLAQGDSARSDGRLLEARDLYARAKQLVEREVGSPVWLDAERRHGEVSGQITRRLGEHQEAFELAFRQRDYKRASREAKQAQALCEPDGPDGQRWQDRREQIRRLYQEETRQ
jgi:hypothetical protein